MPKGKKHNAEQIIAVLRRAEGGDRTQEKWSRLSKSLGIEGDNDAKRKKTYRGADHRRATASRGRQERERALPRGEHQSGELGSHRDT